MPTLDGFPSTSAETLQVGGVGLVGLLLEVVPPRQRVCDQLALVLLRPVDVVAAVVMAARSDRV